GNGPGDQFWAGQVGRWLEIEEGGWALAREGPQRAAIASAMAQTYCVEENGVSVGVDDDEVGRPCRILVGLRLKGDALFFEAALDLAHVGEGFECLSVAVPSRGKGEHVLFEHSLEQANDDVSV